ncbi:MAG TPA: TPM domain-containing protein [Pyrinomonadaceae bacterium]|nr:TPM domain-containing protein [Pyrinomonadaceae bacterium]
MNKTGLRMNWILVFCCSAALFLSLGVTQLAQVKQLPARSAHVNDFAGVLDEKTRQQLENILANLKLKTGIEFDIATVESTGGQDITEFSLQVARDWNIGTRTSAKKSLLLVLAVNEKTSFTRFSRSVQNDLPEGVLGEMGQRMRPLLDAGQFSEGLNSGVQHFVSSIAQKFAFSTDSFDQAPAVISTTSSAAETPSPAGATEVKATEEAGPATVPSPKSEVSATVNSSPVRKDPAPKARRPTSTDDDESEEVEVTLALPLEERVSALKTFIDSHPESKSKVRALELLVSSHAALGDERLKKTDRTGGIEQLMLAISVAPANPSEKLFGGVISQIPLNLYLRGESDAALKAAQNIETKFGNDAKRLVMLSDFYVSTEQGSEATRLATQAVQLAPDLAAAHQALGRAMHISLRLDEAAAEYKRALELDPNSKARLSLADLYRASGKAPEALALYRQQLDAQPADKAARTGLILSQLDTAPNDEAKRELDKALETDPRNLQLLAGAAYWFAAHNDSAQALTLAGKAVAIEPRYTWSQIALARSLVAQRKPLEAERALRFARQYGKFPTLDYELASVLLAAGLYDEAAEVLSQSFAFKEGRIETRLAGQSLVRSESFLELLAPERRASIFQYTAADTETNAKMLKALLAFAVAIDPGLNGGTISEQNAIAAAKEFVAGDDAARVHRELYAASRLLQRGVGFQTAYELAEAARSSADAGLTVPELTLAVQADEFRSIRARAIASGGTPDIPEAPRNVLSNLLRGRIEDTSGWALLNQDKADEAAAHFKRAVTILPEGTPAARSALWHLGVALERQDKKAEALSYYIRSYNSGEPDPVRRALVEQLYRKVNGSLEGLDERIGPAPAGAAEGQTAAANNPETASDKTGENAPAPTPSPALTPVASPVPSSSPSPSTEVPAATPEASPATAAPSPTPDQPASASPEPTPEAVPTPSPETPAASATPSPASTPSLDTSPVETINKPVRATLALTGRVKDSNGGGIANVVVVLISPQGTVLASTTDDKGNYSFTVATASSPRSYRIIPSKDGFAFDPIDRVLAVVSDDLTELDFVEKPVPKP